MEDLERTLTNKLPTVKPMDQQMNEAQKSVESFAIQPILAYQKGT